MRKTSQSQCWWEAPISQLDLQELEQLKDSMEALKKCVTNQASKFMDNQIADSSTFFVDNGNGIFDNYDIKPARTMPSSNDLHNHSLGFDSAALF
ncbi:putative agamous-like MADS-box protein AGL62-like [Capsicum annuum]|nr:putative agamous-like MADS-box protein AGL62-like [Capsicum annuum]